MEPDTVDRERLHPNSYWVIEGHFAAGEYPGDLDPVRAENKVKDLLAGGIDHFIDLTEAHELKPYADLAEEQGRSMGREVGWKRHPIRDQSIPRTREQMTAILDDIDSALGDGKGVYVHCWGGVGRTGTVVGCWLVRHGAPGDEALCQVDRWWRGMQKAVDWWDSPENDAQKEFVRSWSETKDE